MITAEDVRLSLIISVRSLASTV